MTYEEAEKQINPSKGLLFQVWKLGEHYETWVNKYSTNSTYRLFDSPILEPFSRTPWQLVPMVWLPVAAMLCKASIACGASTNNNAEWGLCALIAPSPQSLTMIQMYIGVVFGVLLWTLIEYTLHRFLFHIPANTPTSITLSFLLHGQHHKFPNDGMRLVFPPVAAAIIASIVYLVFCIAFPLHFARAVMAGALLGYVGYDMIHYYLHHGSPHVAYFSRLKQYHMKHHYRDHDHGFGISSKLWDIVFST